MPGYMNRRYGKEDHAGMLDQAASTTDKSTHLHIGDITWQPTPLSSVYVFSRSFLQFFQHSLTCF